MGYDGKILRRALQRYDDERQEREARLQERRQSIFRRQPRLAEIEGELRATMSRLVADALRHGTDPRKAIATLREENLGLQAEKQMLLAGMGLPQDCLEEKPACPLCNDSGYRNGGMCRCLKRCYAREQQKELSRMLDLGTQSFETFSLEWYSPDANPNLGISARENMQWIYRTCRRFAENFAPGCGSLLLTGDPGLGKTFLSAAIAREVSNDGWSVVYDTAGHVFDRFESRKLGREDGETIEADVSRVLNCDLLILDDLGTEMVTSYVQSALYGIINGRLLEHQATILSTNLKLGELSHRYSAQIASRIEGEYQILPFFGEDIRKLKKERS